MFCRQYFLIVVLLLAPIAGVPGQDKLVRVGILGIDNYQCVEYTKHFNDPKAEGDFAGLRVTAAFPVTSDTYPDSAALTAKWKEQLLALYAKPANPADALTREQRIEALMEQRRPQIEQAVRKMVERAVDVPEAEQFGAIEYEFRDAGQGLANAVRQATLASRRKRAT